jgi:hypothetical protein
MKKNYKISACALLLVGAASMMTARAKQVFLPQFG